MAEPVKRPDLPVANAGLRHGLLMWLERFERQRRGSYGTHVLPRRGRTGVEGRPPLRVFWRLLLSALEYIDFGSGRFGATRKTSGA
jgi:hypothetical protein